MRANYPAVRIFSGLVRRTPILIASALVFGKAALGALIPEKALAKGFTASAQTNQQAGADPSSVSVKALEEKLAEVRARLAAAPSDLSLSNAPAGVSAEDVWMRRVLLQRLVPLYEQQLSNIAQLESAKARKAELVREAQAWTRFSEPAPYSIHLVDHIREDLQGERLKINSGEAALVMLDQLTEDNRRLLEQSEERIRQLNEQLETAKDPIVAASLSWQRELERLRSQVAAAGVAAFDSERQVRQEDLGASRTRLGLLQRQVVIADAGAKFTQRDLDLVKVRLGNERQQLERELAEAQSRRSNSIVALESAREELRLAQGPMAVRTTELVSVRETQLETGETISDLLRLMLEAGNVEAAMWEQRFAAYGSSRVEILNRSKDRLGNFRQRLALWGDHVRQQLDVSSSQIRLQESKVNELSPDSELLPPARERLASLRERDQLQLRFSRVIERLDRLTERWGETLQVAEGNLPLADRVRSLFSNAGSFVQRLWNFEIFTAEDSIVVDGQKISGKRSVTVGKIAMAMLILGVGYWATGLISFLVQPLFVKRLKIEPNQANLIRRWVRALMVVCLVMFSLVSVKIPLTVFAFAGGALAIGLGFGMQTLLKNFVSGLIILFERPFRVGDVLDVGGQRGTITGVGLRASVLELWDGTETIIPNSTLLENNLTNWTYSNRKVRFSISVGVAYRSDPRKVTQALSEVADRHGLVEKVPKPQVFFTEFGAGSLVFELRFWVDVTSVNAAQVSSDLRLMITGSFAEQGISIVLPQRDIHLHAAGPIPVEMVPSGTASNLSSKFGRSSTQNHESRSEDGQTGHNQSKAKEVETAQKLDL